MSKATPDPKLAEWHELVDRYEAIRLTGDPEVAHLADDIAFMMEHELRDTLICRNGVRYRVEAGELVRDGNYRRPAKYRRAG